MLSWFFFLITLLHSRLLLFCWFMVLVWVLQYLDTRYLQEDLLFQSVCPFVIFLRKKPLVFSFLFTCTRSEYLIRLNLTKPSFLGENTQLLKFGWKGPKIGYFTIFQKFSRKLSRTKDLIILDFLLHTLHLGKHLLLSYDPKTFWLGNEGFLKL